MTDLIKVLLVEDDHNARIVMTLVLRDKDFDVETAADGREALDMVEIFEPDVILLDLLMPRMDGFEFMRAYKGKAPIIVVSAWSDFKSLPYEPYAKFMKPVRMSEVAPVIARAAGR